MKKLVFVLLAVLTLALAGCQEKEMIVDGSCVDGSKLVTIEVVYEDEEINDTYQYCSNEEFLLGVLEANSEELAPETNEASFGVYLSGLKGFNFETLGMSSYWSIYVNGDYGMLGVADQPVADGDVFKFEATSF